MDAIKLIRNRWFLLAFSACFFGIIWCSFQLVYRDALILRDLYSGNKPPDPVKVTVLYRKMMRTNPDSREIVSFYRLAKVLARTEKRKEVIRILRKLVRIAPKDRELRLWLAVELHNQKRYKEAERHFQLLLKEE
jgi:tetratricopeptide (TPR) repeat protein